MEQQKPFFTYGKIEVAIATFLYAACVSAIFSSGHLMFANLLMVSTTYAAFLTLNFWIWPKYAVTRKYWETIVLTLSVFILTGLAFMVFFSYQRSWEYRQQPSLAQANLSFFSYGYAMASGFLFIYMVYVALREVIAYQHRLVQTTQDMSARIIREVILVATIWFGLMIPIFMFQHTGIFRLLFGPYFFALPYCLIIYFLNLYWLIPSYKQGRISNGAMYFLILLATCVVFGIIEVSFLLQTYYGLSFFGYVLLYWCLPTPIVIGLSWWMYLSNESAFKQLKQLRTALGTSNANLQYLRSQINPHFLFNALNTLYGTALLEKADKTGEGIQKLGDMMRFMLHENNMDRIALSRELDYIHNYIDLQNMRLAISEDIKIDMQIEDIAGYYEIAPMLLIPFIENAYKHGISHQSKSWININLYKRENILHLDVYNSMHPHNDNDPERDQSGTGLDNVKQRLQLSYPGKHELVVRENGKEFFIHLSIELTTIKAL